MTITLITAGFIGILTIILTINVGRQRTSTKTSLGSGDVGSPLHRAVRAHANLLEYAPLMLILLGAMEAMNASYLLVLTLAVAFTVGRYMHGYGLGFTDGSVVFWRMGGTILTLLSLLVASVAALVIGYGG